MKRAILIFLVVVTILVVGLCGHQVGVTMSNISDRVGLMPLDLSVLNSCGLLTNGMGHGSVVAISPNLLLTAGHCIGIPGAWVEIQGKRYEILYEWADDDHDVGFVHIDGRVPYRQIGVVPDLLDTVYLVGSPYRREFVNSVTKGVISHLNRTVYTWEHLIQTDTEGAPGSSGCAMFDSNGRIIGIVVYGPNPGGGVTLCESSLYIRVALLKYCKTIPYLPSIVARI